MQDSKQEVEVEVNSIERNTQFIYLSDNTISPQTPLYIPTTGVLGVRTSYSSYSDYYWLLNQYSWDAGLMNRIMLCESSGNEKAHNYNPRTKDNSYGLFQINLWGAMANTRPAPEKLLQAEHNIAYAYEIWKVQGYNAWRNCYRLTASK